MRAIPIALIAVPLLCAATRDIPERGFRPGAPLTLNDVDSIDNVTGNVSLSVPLATLPPGRAGMTIGVSLRYHSAQYELAAPTTISLPGVGDDIYHRLSGSFSGGWTYSFKYSWIVEARTTSSNCTPPESKKSLRLSLVLPDGSRRPMRPYPRAGHDMTDLNGDGYYQYDAAGVKSTCSTEGSYTGKMVYFSTDGSLIRFEFDRSSSCSAGDPSTGPPSRVIPFQRPGASTPTPSTCPTELQTSLIRVTASTTVCSAVQNEEPLRLDYTYGGSANNGNVQGVTLRRGTSAWTQSFVYDGRNRITHVSDSAFNQKFAYDFLGNMAIDKSGSNLLPAGDLFYPNVASDPNGNAAAALFKYNRWNGAAHDGAGNQTGVNSGSYSFTYDAENRVLTASVPNMTASYAYDGEGRRVRKTVQTSQGAAAYIYVYDAFGRLATELSSGTPPLVPGRHYLVPDALGSTRLVMDASGNQERCFDYTPFGSEVPGSYRASLSCYGSSVYPGGADAISNKFTGKERDAETGLDFFGARYLSAAQGRFTSPDEPFVDQHPEDPQSWNLYGYVRNNPLAHVDTDGQACFALNGGSAFCGRATEYGQIDARVSGQTRFFAAASAVSQALANSDVGYGGFISRAFPQISGSTQQFLGAVGQDLLQMNRSAAADIQSGKLSGPDLDARMVHMEQSKVESSLKALEKKDPAAYNTLIAESNAGLNPTDRMRKVGSVYSTDKAYLGVLDGVRKQLGRDIDFRRQSDREAIGNALIHHIRQKGGCDVTGDKVAVCQ